MVEKTYIYQNTVQRIAGTLGQELLMIVSTVGRKSLLLKASTNHIVTRIAEINTTGLGSKVIRATCGKVVRLLKTRYCGLRLLLESGGRRFLREIITPAFYAVTSVAREIGLNSIQTTLKDLQTIQNLRLNSIMGELYVLNAIGQQTHGETISDPKYCDVIRKRYAKFIGKEDTWQEATPAIKNRK